MPQLVRLYIKNVLIGFAIAGAFVGMVLWFNLGNMWHLVSSSDIGLLAVFVLWFCNGVVFAGVQFGIAVMAMKEDDGPRGGLRQWVRRRLPVAVPVRADEDHRRTFLGKR